MRLEGGAVEKQSSSQPRRREKNNSKTAYSQGQGQVSKVPKKLYRGLPAQANSSTSAFLLFMLVTPRPPTLQGIMFGRITHLLGWFHEQGHTHICLFSDQS